jgi:hypothetical protein
MKKISLNDLTLFDQKIATIDFLKINIDINYSQIKKEFDNWINLNEEMFLSDFRGPEGRSFNLEVIGIWDIVNNPLEAGTYGPLIKKDQLKKIPGPTDLKTNFVETVNELEKISGLMRAKFSRLQSKKSVPWHSHPPTSSREVVLHLPLITNPLVTNLVSIKNSVSSTQFSEGELWLFGSAPTQRHSVINDSLEDRWSLWMNINILDQQQSIINRYLFDAIMCA